MCKLQFCNQVFSIVIFLELLQDLKWKFVWIWRHCALFSICALQCARHATWFLCIEYWMLGLVKKLPMISFQKGPATLKPPKGVIFEAMLTWNETWKLERAWMASSNLARCKIKLHHGVSCSFCSAKYSDGGGRLGQIDCRIKKNIFIISNTTGRIHSANMLYHISKHPA